MKPRNKIILCVLAVPLLIGIGTFQFSRSMMITSYGGVVFPKDIKVERVAVGENGQIVRVDQVGTSGGTLEIQIRKEEIQIPWTLYLPFYQFGTISSRLVFDAQVLDQHWESLSVSVSGSTTRYAVIPKVFRKDEIKSQLVDTLFKAVEVRIAESRK